MQLARFIHPDGLGIHPRTDGQRKAALGRWHKTGRNNDTHGKRQHYECGGKTADKRQCPNHSGAMRLRFRPRKVLALPLATFFRDAQDVIGRLARLKRLGGIGIAWVHIRMRFLGDLAPRLFRVLKSGIAFEA